MICYLYQTNSSLWGPYSRRVGHEHEEENSLPSAKKEDDCYDVCLLVDHCCGNIELGAHLEQRCNFGVSKNVSRQQCTRSYRSGSLF